MSKCLPLRATRPAIVCDCRQGVLHMFFSTCQPHLFHSVERGPVSPVRCQLGKRHWSQRVASLIIQQSKSSSNKEHIKTYEILPACMGEHGSHRETMGGGHPGSTQHSPRWPFPCSLANQRTTAPRQGWHPCRSSSGGVVEWTCSPPRCNDRQLPSVWWSWGVGCPTPQPVTGWGGGICTGVRTCSRPSARRRHRWAAPAAAAGRGG